MMNLDAILDGLDVLLDATLALGLSMARMAGVISVFPVFTRTEIGRLVRAILAIVFSVPIAGQVWAGADALGAVPGVVAVALVLKEAALGILMGVAMGAPFWAIQAVGELIDQQRELGDSSQQDPAAQGQASVSAALLMMCAIVIFVTAGGIRILLDLVYQSYAVWPLGAFLPVLSADELLPVLRILDDILGVALVMAAPVLLLFLLCDVTVGLIGRATPEFGVESFGPLFKNILYAFVMTIYMYLLLGYARTHLAEVRSILGLLDVLVR